MVNTVMASSSKQQWDTNYNVQKSGHTIDIDVGRNRGKVKGVHAHNH